MVNLCAFFGPLSTQQQQQSPRLTTRTKQNEIIKEIDRNAINNNIVLNNSSN
uniref:Uncharacterized protein n=1 Tax=Arundo donax TaxID=35708 RepID=A0A0A8YAS8_ARUDO